MNAATFFLALQEMTLEERNTFFREFRTTCVAAISRGILRQKQSLDHAETMERFTQTPEYPFLQTMFDGACAFVDSHERLVGTP